MADFAKPLIDHLNIGVTDIDRSSDFYAAALAPLGIRRVYEITADRTESGERIHGFGETEDRPVFWLVDKQTAGTNLHLAFQAETRAQVDAFYEGAMAHGGIDHGKPGLRHYHPHYYGAFVLDPDGFNIEAVCHASE